MSGWWKCAGCDEKLQDQFDTCWKCGSKRDASNSSEGAYYLDKTPECPKCGFRMESGILRDSLEGGAYTEAEWLEGGKGPGLKIQGYRCDNCGLLELYAKK